MTRGEIHVVHDGDDGRIVVTDSVTFCDGRVGPRDVLVAGSFAGPLALGLALEHGVRAVLAHAAGRGRDDAGIAGLAVADALGVAMAAVETMSARLGDGMSVLDEGIVAHVNQAAVGFGVVAGLSTREAARRLLRAPAGRRVARGTLVDRQHRVVAETRRGRVVLIGSASFAGAENGRDVLCVGSHGGRVNARPLLVVRPRGVIFNDGGMAKDDSGADGLGLLAQHDIAAATVGAMSARIGDPTSTWETGVISAVNEPAAAVGVCAGQTAREAAHLMLTS